MADLVSGDKVIITVIILITILLTVIILITILLTVIILITILLTVIQVILIMDAFNSLADQSGLVNTRELGSLMKRLGENPTKEEVQVRVDMGL